MKVLNLRCAAGHGFEGWFASEDDFSSQSSRGLLTCPSCGEASVARLPSAPRLNLSGATRAAGARSDRAAGLPIPPTGASAAERPAALQAAWMSAVREVLSRTEDVGERFPEEARRIHYGEAEARGIRGQATPEEREALSDEGIEVLALPIPDALKGPTH